MKNQRNNNLRNKDNPGETHTNQPKAASSEQGLPNRTHSVQNSTYNSQGDKPMTKQTGTSNGSINKNINPNHTSQPVIMDGAYNHEAIPSIVEEISKELFGLEMHTQKILEQIFVYLNLTSFTEKPLVINLWGATGTGKTQLVKRVLAALGLDKDLKYMNLVETTKPHWQRVHDTDSDTVHDVKRAVHRERGEDREDDRKMPPKPVVMLLDDFQHLRFIDQKGMEKGSGEIYEIFRILDEGFMTEDGKSIPTIIFITGNIGLSQNESVGDWFQRAGKQEEPNHMPLEHVQKALCPLFRPEMIARLKNTHLFFPSVSKHIALKIVERDTKKIQRSIEEYLKVTSCDFEDSVADVILDSLKNIGMGARSVETQVRESIGSGMNEFMRTLSSNHHSKTDVEAVVFRGGGSETLVVEAKLWNGESISCSVSLKEPIPFEIDPNPEELIIQAVHEAGHAVCYYMLTGESPDSIMIGLKTGEMRGFVKADSKKRYINFKRLRNDVSVSLGGYFAEKMVFGDSHMTIGSSSDLERVSDLLMKAILKYGFGDPTAKLAHPNPFGDEDHITMNKKDKRLHQTLLNESIEVTTQLLEEQRSLLIAVAKKLFEDKEMDEKQFGLLVQDHLCEGEGIRTPEYAFDYLDAFTAFKTTFGAVDLDVAGSEVRASGESSNSLEV